ncbi:MAG: ATP-dependent helicase [Alphaproteobacteria bacterium]|nr:ATP-dependent helicase [Alphaproteobacteria bacterium]
MYKQNYKKNNYANTVKQSRVVREWSEYQKNIFSDISNGVGNTQVDALAGTGKTSTIVEGFYHLPRHSNSLMCAFNKSIQTELETRAPNSVTVRTLHSLGYAACRKAFPKLGSPDSYKLDGYLKAEKGDDKESYEIRTNLGKLVSLSKGYLADNAQQMDEIMDRHEIDTCGDSREKFIDAAMRIMEATKRDTARVDFDDMIWLPNVLNLKMDKYDYVFIDEAQDLNTAQINLALTSVNGTGRIISVGDEHQAIYGFRGADSNAIQNIVDRLGSKRMPLSVTYRCAKNIVELAKTIVPEIEAAPDAENGMVEEIGLNQMENLVKPGDFILSRVNAPLIKWCLILLKNKVPANIQGRDMGKSMTALIKKSKCNTVDDLLVWLDEYEAMESERMLKRNLDSGVIHDKMECIRVLCDGVKSIAEVKENIDRLFKDGDDKDRVILSSTHKAKGLERDRVFMLKDTYKPGKSVEESNLAYVAYTRAKKELYLVNGK